MTACIHKHSTKHYRKNRYTLILPEVDNQNVLYITEWWKHFSSHKRIIDISYWSSFPLYNDVIMDAVCSTPLLCSPTWDVKQSTSLTIVYSDVYSGEDQRKHQSSASLAFVREIHRWPVNCPHKCPVTRKTFPFDNVVMDKLHSISMS